MAGRGSAVIDFGAFPGSNEATPVEVLDSAILVDSYTDAFITAKATTDHTVVDHTYAKLFIAISAGAPVAGVGFTVHATSFEKMVGTFNITWVWV